MKKIESSSGVRGQDEGSKDFVGVFEKICKTIELDQGDDIPIITEFLEF